MLLVIDLVIKLELIFDFLKVKNLKWYNGRYKERDRNKKIIAAIFFFSYSIYNKDREHKMS